MKKRLLPRMKPMQQAIPAQPCQKHFSWRRSFAAAGLGVLLAFGQLSGAWAAGYPRQLVLETGPVPVLVNDTGLSLSEQPVYTGGQWYLPVEALAPYLNYRAQFDSQENWLALTTSGGVTQQGVNHWAGELARVSYEMEMLQRHKDSLQQEARAQVQTIVPKLWEYEKDIATRREMEVFLEEHFGQFRSTPVEISLRAQGDHDEMRLHLTIDDRDESDFLRIPTRAVTAYLEEMYDAILGLYDEKAKLSGWIRSEDTQGDDGYTTLFTFRSVPGTRGRLSVSAVSDSDADRDAEKALGRVAEKMRFHLMDQLPSYEGVHFSYQVTANHEDLELTATIHRQDLNRYVQWKTPQRESFLRRLASLAAEIDPKPSIYGRVLESQSGDVREVFMLEGGNLYGWERHPDYWFDRNELEGWADEFENQRYSDYWARDRWWQDSHWSDTTGVVPRPEVGTPPILQSQQTTVTMFPLHMTVDGQSFHSQEEMFRWNNTLYVPMDELSDALYLTASAGNGQGPLALTANPAADPQAHTTMVRQLQAQQTALATLREEVAQLQEKAVAALREPVLRPHETVLSVPALQRYLEERYSFIQGIYADIQLSRLRGDQYRLRIWIDEEQAEDFDQISQFRIENWVLTMQAAIREMYDEKAEVEGWIRSTAYDEIHDDEALYIRFRPRGNELTFNFEGHGGQGARRDIDMDHLLRELRRNIRNFAGRTFTYEGDQLRRRVELRVITSQRSFMDLKPEDKSDYLNDLMAEVHEVYPGLEVDGLMMSSSQAPAFFRFSFEGGRVVSPDLLDDLAVHLERDQNQFGQLRFAYQLREDPDGTVRLRMNGSFAQQDAHWKNTDKDLFEAWAEDLFKTSAELLQRRITGEVRDRNDQVLWVKTVSP